MNWSTELSEMSPNIMSYKEKHSYNAMFGNTSQITRCSPRFIITEEAIHFLDRIVTR